MSISLEDLMKKLPDAEQAAIHKRAAILIEMEAARRLRNAAPAMLAALEQAERMLIHYGAHKDHDGGVAALQAVNAAIAKATSGEGQS